MDFFSKVKAAVIAVFTAISSWMGVLAYPMLVLVLLNITDYATGLMASKNRGQKISSYQGIKGIAKKICMWLLVGIGAVIDWVLTFAAETIGLTLPFSFAIASLAAIWLICNEIISILENIGDIGVTLPPFLMNVVKRLKSKAEENGNIDTEDKE